MLARAAFKSINSYMAKKPGEDSTSNTPPPNTVMGQLNKQKSESEIENESMTDAELNRADDFKVFRKPNDAFEADSMMVVQVEENERFDPRSNTWSSANLLPSDPAKFKSSLGYTNVFPEIPAPEGMSFFGYWEIDDQIGFEDGWMYSTNFLELDLGRFTKLNIRTVVRRKRWIRRVIPKEYESESQKINPNTDIGSHVTDREEPKIDNDDVEDDASSVKGTFTSPSQLAATDISSSSLGETTVDKSMVNIADNFEFDYEEDLKERESVVSDMPSARPESYNATSIMRQANTPARRTSWFGFGSSSTTLSSSPTSGGLAAAAAAEAKASLSDPALRVRGTTLSAIGKQIKFVEGECKKDEELRMKEWKEATKPKLELRILELEKKILEIKSLIEKEVGKESGLENSMKLEEQYVTAIDRLDATKRELYFPFTELTVGTGGVYLAITDFWVEYTSGSFFLELCPNKRSPEINIRLGGTKKSEVDGVMARLKVEGFRLAGDKGKNIPKLKFDSLMVTIAFNFSACLQYDVDKSKWFIDPKLFQVNILSFKGPYGLNRSIVALVVSLLTPTIRSELLKNLPFELGLLVKTLSCPFTMEGEFDIKGVNVRSLNTEFAKNDIFMKLLNYSPLQMEMFYWMQKSLDRSNTMKTVADLIAYVRAHSRTKGMWEQLVNLWSQATLLYCEKVALAKTDPNTLYSNTANMRNGSYMLPQYTILFEKFLEGADSLQQKRIGANFSLTQLDGQVSLNHFLSFAFQILHRLFTDAVGKSSSVEKVRLMNALERLKTSYQLSLEGIKAVSKNLDFVQFNLQLDAHAGPEGCIGVIIKDVLAQAPALFKNVLSEDKNIGVLPLVPYIVSLKPQENGDVFIEVYHFSHDSFEAPVASTVAAGNKDLSETASNQDSEPSELHRTNSMASTSQPNPQGTPSTGNNAAAALGNIQTGQFCTSYNKVVSAITSGRVCPRNNNFFLRQADMRTFMDTPFDAEHLEVKVEDQKRVLDEVLADVPRGEDADTVISVSATSPHVSMIVDHAITLKPGAELFTLVMGPTKPGWKPFGTTHTFEEDGSSQPEDSTSGKLSPTPAPKKKSGWPIFMQTAPGVKFLAKVPKSEVNVNMPSLFRFLLAHFTDLPQLKAYLESFVGGEFFEEHLLLVKFILEKISKYCLVPGLDLFLNLNGKILSLNGEILVRVETSDLVNPLSAYNSKAVPAADPCAIKLKAQLSLREIIEDVNAIDKYFKITTEAVEGTRLQQQARQQDLDADYLTLDALSSLQTTPAASQGPDLPKVAAASTNSPAPQPSLSPSSYSTSSKPIDRRNSTRF